MPIADMNTRLRHDDADLREENTPFPSRHMFRHHWPMQTGDCYADSSPALLAPIVAITAAPGIDATAWAMTPFITMAAPRVDYIS